MAEVRASRPEHLQSATGSDPARSDYDYLAHFGNALAARRQCLDFAYGQGYMLFDRTFRTKPTSIAALTGLPLDVCPSGAGLLAVFDSVEPGVHPVCDVEQYFGQDVTISATRPLGSYTCIYIYTGVIFCFVKCPPRPSWAGSSNPWALYFSMVRARTGVKNQSSSRDG